VPDFVWIQEVVFPLIGMGMGAFVLYGVYRTVNRILDRRHETRLRGGSGVTDEVERLRLRLDQLEEQGLRMQELEERLDFAERMLAQHANRPIIGGEH